jgi:hypothetical protein
MLDTRIDLTISWELLKQLGEEMDTNGNMALTLATNLAHHDCTICDLALGELITALGITRGKFRFLAKGE